MKIQVIKKADRKTPNSKCSWFIEGLAEPRK